MFKLPIALLFVLSTAIAQPKYIEFKPMTWEELQVFQLDSLLTLKQHHLNSNCPGSLKDLNNNYSKDFTFFEDILGTNYIWTEFLNDKKQKCIVKHHIMVTLDNPIPNQNDYQILSKLQAQILLSASYGNGFESKGVSHESMRIEASEIFKKNNETSIEHYKMYGGIDEMIDYSQSNEPENKIKSMIEIYKDQLFYDQTSGPLRSYSTEVLMIMYFEKAYSKKQKQQLINRVKNRVYTKSNLRLLDKEWVLIAYQENDEVKKEVLSKSSYKIHLEKDIIKYTGYIDCNSISGRYLLDKNKLNFKGMLTTQIGCGHFPTKRLKVYNEKLGREILTFKNNPKEKLYYEQSDQISNILDNITNYKFEADTLVLLTDDSRKLYFR
jgi:heat shock protein HslJ